MRNRAFDSARGHNRNKTNCSHRIESIQKLKTDPKLFYVDDIMVCYQCNIFSHIAFESGIYVDVFLDCVCPEHTFHFLLFALLVDDGMAQLFDCSQSLMIYFDCINVHGNRMTSNIDHKLNIEHQTAQQNRIQTKPMFLILRSMPQSIHLKWWIWFCRFYFQWNYILVNFHVSR